MRLGTFTANIIVDGKALDEYDVTFQSPTKAICWVASEEGKWKCHEESRVAGARGLVSVDGVRCGGYITWPGTLGVNDTCTLSQLANGASARDLMFTRIQLSDDDSLLNKEIHKNLGEISLVIERGEIVTKRRSGHGSTDHRNLSVLGNNERLHERSKKATVHCVAFGPEKARTRSRHRRQLIPNNEPEITFVFKYQPLGVLQANGLAPRPASKPAGAGHASCSVGSHVKARDESTQMNDRIRSLEDELKRLRNLQASSSEDRKPKRIKAEDLGERRHFTPGEVIDLT